MVKYGTIVQPLRCVRPVFTQIACQCENLGDRPAQQRPHARVVGFDPSRKREARVGRPVHIDQCNVDGIPTIEQTLTRLVVGYCFQDPIPTFTKVFGKRVAYEHIVLHDQNRCCFHAALQRQTEYLSDQLGDALRIVGLADELAHCSGRSTEAIGT